MRKSIERVLLTALLLTAGAGMAAIQGTIVTTDGKRLDGEITWKSRDKAYGIRASGPGNIELTLERDMIARLLIPKPAELTAIEASLKRGEGAAAAIPVLNKIINDYFMLIWDRPATRLLAEAYVKDNDPSNAIKVCERVIAADPTAAYQGDMAPAYWAALLMGDRTARLDDLITQAVKNADRSASAFALIMRGDMIRKDGDTNESASRALRDGYLRVITLYSGIKAAQPEALYKAAKCFEKLGHSSRADQMRTKLKGEYSSSEWALK
ncbi:MAG: tetratricopeptide repeat protein [Kiritimatiellae bacterium]|nr:tetratricopeptide repeat protein [Kiritimatiellia bacterium]